MTRGYFSSVDVACIDSDKNIFFTSMNFDVDSVSEKLALKTLTCLLHSIFHLY